MKKDVSICWEREKEMYDRFTKEGGNVGLQSGKGESIEKRGRGTSRERRNSRYLL